MQLEITVDDTYLDNDEFEVLVPAIAQDLEAWIGEKQSVTLITPSSHPRNKLGLQLTIKSKFKLKDPLKFLYEVAKTHQCEFVISMMDEETGNTEDVCYFGFEEGKPDMYEVANYLDL